MAEGWGPGNGRALRVPGVAVQTDPVCGVPLSPGDGAHSHDHCGRTYCFCGARCLQAFRDRPEAYVERPESLVAVAVDPRRPELPRPKPYGYACPMHPRRLWARAGTCPVCGLLLEPQASAEEAERHRAQADLGRRLWSSVALTVPLLVIALVDRLAGHPLRLSLPQRALDWFELALATPVVFVGGRRIFERAWRAAWAGAPDRFLLLALGVGLGWASSVVATVAPWWLGASAWDGWLSDGLYFRTSALVVTLALFFEQLEVRVIGEKRLPRPFGKRVPPAGARAGAATAAGLRRRAGLEIASRRAASLLATAGLGFAAAAFAWWALPGAGHGVAALGAGLAVLIVACPWSLVLAAPASLALGSHRAARLGLRVQRAEALEALGRADTLVLAAERLLAEARPRLVAFAALPGRDEKALLRLAALAARAGGDEVAAALREGAHERGIELPEGRPARRRRGAALVEGRRVALVGAERLRGLGLEAGQLAPLVERCRQAGGIPLLILVDGGLAGGLALSGQLAASTRRGLGELRASGLRVVLLARERCERSRLRARRLEVDEVRVASPARRAEFLARLQRRGRMVAFVPGGGESQRALEQADVALLAPPAESGPARAGAAIVLGPGGLLREIGRARGLALATVRNIRQSLGIAAACSLLAWPAAAGVLHGNAGVWLPPEVAAMVLGAGVLAVVANAWRLRRARL